MSQLRVGDVIRLFLDDETHDATVISAGGGPLDPVEIRLHNGTIARMTPSDVRFEIIERAPVHAVDTINTTKEDDNMNSAVANHAIAARPVSSRRVLPTISTEDLMEAARVYEQPLPDGRVVKVSVRKISSHVAKLYVEDVLGTRIFTILASKKDAGDIYVAEKVTTQYNDKDGQTKEAVVMECTGQANALVKAIAKNVMAAEGITLGASTGELPRLPNISF